MATTPLPLVPGARLDLQGTCNRCGLCCTTVVDGLRLVCEHLVADTSGYQLRPLGTADASRCRVYERRVSGMPIVMRDGTGHARQFAKCYKDAWQEDHVIVERGIGQGCSLTLPLSEGQLVAFTPDRR